MQAMQQMKWSVLVDKIVANARKYDKGEQTVQEYSQNNRELTAELAEEIKTDPYKIVRAREEIAQGGGEEQQS